MWDCKEISGFAMLSRRIGAGGEDFEVLTTGEVACEPWELEPLLRPLTESEYNAVARDFLGDQFIYGSIVHEAQRRGFDNDSDDDGQDDVKHSEDFTLYAEDHVASSTDHHSCTMTALKIVVSGAAGQIAYSLLPLICIGHIFGPNQRVELRLLDIEPAQEALEGVKMELQDCAFNLVDAIVPTADLETAFKDVDVAILVGGFPRKQGMQRKDLIEKNVAIFKAQGAAIDKFASRDVKVLVVANPANTNCLTAMENAPSIPRRNFSALTRLDHERLRSFLVEKVNATQSTKVTSKDVNKVVIWGNHSSTQVPDVTNAEVKGQPLDKIVSDKDWVEKKLVKDVQERGAAIIKARKLSSAMSAAAAIGAHLRDWFNGSKDGEFVSMAICSDGNKYGVPEGLIYSFPVKCTGNGAYEVVNGLPISPRIDAMMKATAQELTEEKADAVEILTRQ
ncbi:hypothetical protein JG687_00002574 [Phytophthora cactorum]|uniref:malate dehydrogenase n=1 Tax=Phytophthora cactorum TaxID=29920 RepID=A0A8T1UTZ3_9STRA|nr:hypothetical protein JG687_00002574 [Phytophthora cactorum]